ncbi:MAG: SDR family oxidoreductase [Clostridiales bacterium]|nr:SDR family oxidoreductase [Clostridiales bacterium]
MTEITNTFLDIEPLTLANTCIEKDSLKGEVAVVTGSTSNVGLGYVRAIAWAGGKVVVSGRNEKAGREAERVINAENGPGTALFVKCDVTLEEDVLHLAKRANEAFGKVDILVNNAMNLALNGPVLASPVSDLEQSFAISGRGTMLTIQAFVPAMLERKHGVVVYSPTQFHYSPPMIGGAMYTAGKAAGTSITMSLANEIGPYEKTGVGVFCMIPSGVGRVSPSRRPVSPDGRELGEPPRSSTYGFNGPIPPEANAAGLVYSILRADKLHGSGISVIDAFHEMQYPFPHPENAMPSDMRRLTDHELTLVFRNSGPGFR